MKNLTAQTKLRRKRILILVVITGLILFSFAGCSKAGNSTIDSKSDLAYVEYHCDVKNFELSTAIEISKDGEAYGKVKGNIFTFVTDPLTLYDVNEQKIAYAGDAYHFIAQDSHTIYVDSAFSIEMVGLVDWWGNSYEIYDENQELIYNATFDAWNTSGSIYDVNGNLIALYESEYLFNDFTVKIYKDCPLDDNTVLMIFASYYSDCAYDNA